MLKLTLIELVIKRVFQSSNERRFSNRNSIPRSFSLRMRLVKKLRRNLSKIVDKSNRRVSLKRILNAENVDLAFVKKRMKKIVNVERSVAALFKTENQVDPLRNIRRNVRTFQRCSMNSDKFARTSASPIRQNDVAKFSPALFLSKIEFVLVFEKFRKIKELWNGKSKWPP